jgi:hypothetical protein
MPETTPESAESATPTKSATATKPAVSKPAAKTVPTTKPTDVVKVKMLTSQAGYHQVPVLDAAGQQVLRDDGIPVTRNGHEFVRNPNQEYEMPAYEADRLIDAGYAILVG